MSVETYAKILCVSVLTHCHGGRVQIYCRISGGWEKWADVSQKDLFNMVPFAVPSSLGQHVPVPVHCCSLSLLIMCSAATRPVRLILLIRDTDTQSCTQRMELQPFPTRRWGYGRVADEENPEWCGCLYHTCCWTGIRCGKSTANQWHAAFCCISVLTSEGASLLADSWTQALIFVSHGAGKWKLWQSKTQEVSLQPP